MPNPPTSTVQPVLVNFADHAEQLRLTVTRALDQARALQIGWELEADPDAPADASAATALAFLVVTLEAAQRSAEITERRILAATAEPEVPADA